MNWKELNQAYPLATREYLRSEDIITNDSKTMVCTLDDVDDSTYFFKTDNEESFCIGSEEVLKMPEYFDELGIHVDTLSDSPMYQIWINGNLTLMSDEQWNDGDMLYTEAFTGYKRFPTRREALEVGVIKAFEIREEQLKKGI